jgi:hypothetical protein
MKIVYWQMLGVTIAAQIKMQKHKSQQRAGAIILSIGEVSLVA